jgi:diguanylate cyclase (GGDEF)-like protein/PAS domain S-box-containing protein
MNLSETILLIGDDASMHLALEQQLDRLGYRILMADSGQVALECLRRECIDLVLLDRTLTDLGSEAVQIIMQLHAIQQVPILVMAAQTDQECITSIIAAGASDYLITPVHPLLLQNHIAAIFAQTRLQTINQYLEAAIMEQASLTDEHAASLYQSEQRYVLAAQATNDGLWDWSLLRGAIYYSPRWKAMIGYAGTELSTHPDEWFLRIHPDDREAVNVRLAAYLKRMVTNFEHEYRILHSDGEYRWMSCRAIAIWDAIQRATRIVGAQTDITAQKLAEQRVMYNAFHDTLTGLANRALLLERLGHTMTRSQRSDATRFAVLLFDLDRFKVINDSMGHLIGDQLLIGLARRIEGCVRPGDTFARLGGDEFAILLEQIADPNDAIRVADRILQALKEPFIFGGQEAFTGASIGILLSTTSDYLRPDDVIRDADTAMYHAKMQGKGRYTLFDAGMHNNALALLQIETDLRHGLERGELQVHYQPIVALNTQQVMGFEALTRWHHPDRGMIPPSEFIPIAEETGMIGQIGEWVLRTACRQLQIWHAQYPTEPLLNIHVNLSPRQFQHGDLVQQVVDILQETRIPARTLTLELTESALIIQGDEPGGLLQQLHALGVQLCIDDFGTGYSSLSYLHRFPIDSLKIDRSFIHQMGVNAENLELVRTIVSLTHSLGITAVAEGTETVDQLAQLRELACNYAQGWAFGAAVDAAHATALLYREQQASA